MKYKVIKEFGCARKGDVIEQNGDFWGLKVETDNSTREVYLSGKAMEDMVEDGYLSAFEDEAKDCECCDTLTRVSEFVEEKLEQYKEDYDSMIEAYGNQEIPTCVKVEAETVYYNLTKVLNSIKNLINE